MAGDFIVENDGQLSFVAPGPTPREKPPLVAPIDVPLWTRNKARLVRDYLILFVQVTHHGTYLDAFAGPQDMAFLDTWAARLVLDVQQLQHFHFFERHGAGVVALEMLRAERSDRDITVWTGDVNVRLPDMLRSGGIPPKEATFCLLDQRTFECHWTTLETLARHKAGERYKVELFYFLAEKWLDRAIKEQEDPGPPSAWWGRDDWRALRGLPRRERVDRFVRRFVDELGYRYVMPWPILERDASGSPVMYYMIHASDHQDAPGFMRRAYNSAVQENPEQMHWSWGRG
jgi:three-Cys-motif partner protein